jgi:anti-anti-sigma regulatory factor
MEARLLWPSAQERADLRSTAGTIVIDAADLDFIDRRGLSAVIDYGERHDTTVVLRTRPSTPARLFELLDLTGVRVERAW